MGRAAAVTANALIASVAAYVAMVATWYPETYYAILQEDGSLEWSTFWAFAVASTINAVAAFRQAKDTRRIPWFLLGLALFCFFVAMEEISWGQRLIGYRPPRYFLAHNFQQELNIHNVFSTHVRIITLKAVILGYGALLPLVNMAPPLHCRLERSRVISPPAALIPSFVLTYALYEWYPWKYTGETVELLLGLGFLFASIIALCGLSPSSGRERQPLATPLSLAGAWAVVLALGFLNASHAHRERQASSEYLGFADAEAKALRQDFVTMARASRKKLITRCNLHNRVYTYKKNYRRRYLAEGVYAGLVDKGLAAERAEFFLDPWHSPYWIRDYCDPDDTRSRSVFVYSFGPNRRRDSSATEIRGDDIGAYVLKKP